VLPSPSPAPILLVFACYPLSGPVRFPRFPLPPIPQPSINAPPAVPPPKIIRKSPKKSETQIPSSGRPPEIPPETSEFPHQFDPPACLVAPFLAAVHGAESWRSEIRGPVLGLSPARILRLSGNVIGLSRGDDLRRGSWA
jgi:hypothetical protein